MGEAPLSSFSPVWKRATQVGEQARRRHSTPEQNRSPQLSFNAPSWRKPLTQMIAAFSVLSAVESRERSLSQASSKDDVAFFAVRLVAISALVLSPASASAQAKWGDVNGDGVVGAVDAQAILSAVVGLPLPTGFTKANGDASCDGTLGAVDAQIACLPS